VNCFVARCSQPRCTPRTISVSVRLALQPARSL